jgi:hypothetical protein
MADRRGIGRKTGLALEIAAAAIRAGLGIDLSHTIGLAMWQVLL